MSRAWEWSSGWERREWARATIVSGLLIAGFADNKTDSLSIHMYQEAEKVKERAALGATFTNFVARILAALTFVVIVPALPASGVIMCKPTVSPEKRSVELHVVLVYPWSFAEITRDHYRCPIKPRLRVAVIQIS